MEWVQTIICIPVIALSTSTDSLYIGSVKPFNSILVHPHATSYLPAGVSLTATYWNGASWVALPNVQDNTSDHQATPSTMSYAGSISFDMPNDWTAIQIATDPMTIYQNAILAGDAWPPGMFYHPFRYFINLSISSLPGVLLLVTLLQL